MELPTVKSFLYKETNENCTAPQMIPDRKWSPDHKWSPNWTANDPEPQVIPDVNRKWSRRKTTNGMDFGFLDFLLIGDVYFLLVWRWLLD